MTCEELRQEYELYALGLSGEPEKSALGEHLREGCRTCTDGVRGARSTMTLLASSAEPMAPPPRLRRRIMASVGVESRSWGWFMPLWAAVSAFCLVAAFYFYGRDRDNAMQLARARQAARTQSIELARSNELLAFLNQPETRQVTFGGGAAAPPGGRVLLHPKSGVLLLASNLPAAPPGKTYEMWLIPKSGNPNPAGMFQSEADGSAMHRQRMPLDLAAIKAVAVTLEPSGGVPQPTTEPLIIAPL